MQSPPGKCRLIFVLATNSPIWTANLCSSSRGIICLLTVSLINALLAWMAGWAYLCRFAVGHYFGWWLKQCLMLCSNSGILFYKLKLSQFILSNPWYVPCSSWRCFFVHLCYPTNLSGLHRTLGFKLRLNYPQERLHLLLRWGKAFYLRDTGSEYKYLPNFVKK